MCFRNSFFFKVIIPLCFLAAGITDLYTQVPFYKQISEEFGLASNDVYDILVSDKGQLWFATDNGVCRYNGIEFVNFNIEDGLPSSTVIKLYEDYEGKIWFLSYNGMLSYHHEGQISKYPYNDSIEKYFSDNYFGKICLDSAGALNVSPRQGGNAVIDANGNVNAPLSQIPVLPDSCFLYFEDNGDDHFITIQNLKSGQCRQNGKLFYDDAGYYIHVQFTSTQFQRHYLKTRQGHYILSYRNWVYVVKNHELISQRSFEEEVLSLYEDREGKVWVSVKYDHGIYRFEEADLQGEPIHFFDGYTITNVLQDWEEDFWLSTEGQGVFFVPGFEFSTFGGPGNNQEINVMGLAIGQGRIWFSTRDMEVYSGRVSNGYMQNIRKLNIEKPNDWIKHILIDKYGYLWLSSTRHLRYDPAGFPVPPDSVVNVNFLGRGNGDTIFAANKKLGIYWDGKLMKFFLPDIEKRIYTAFQQKDVIWLGTLYGLYKYHDDVFVNFKQHSSILADRVNCIKEIRDLLIVGTTRYGIAFVRGDSLVYNISEDNGLLGNTVKSIFVQNDSIIWVGTKNGLNKIIIEDAQQYSIENYGQCDGLPSDEINAIAMHDGYIWLATGNGLVSFNPNELHPHLIPPQINILGIQIHGIDTELLDTFYLDHDENDIRITFAGLSLRQKSGLRYRYQMSDYNSEMVETKNNWANFPSMPPGEYTFYVNVGNQNGIWNDTPQTIYFNISRHFTQTIGFLVLLIVISSLIVLGLSLFIQWQRKIKREAKNEMARMEQKVFRLQMNPHFVFNALLAIQGFMYQCNTHDAGRYLTSFAKLIRHTLYGSSEELIPLDKEIEAMQYYMELQRLRFNNKFEFNIDVADDIIPEAIYVPPLLIQPFLENAIEHGLQHKSENGELSLKIDQVNQSLRIEIEDNGIGREESAIRQVKRSKLHKSLGMGIVNSRIESLKKVTGKKIVLEIIDLKDQQEIGIGTLVRIIIPN